LPGPGVEDVAVDPAAGLEPLERRPRRPQAPVPQPHDAQGPFGTERVAQGDLPAPAEPAGGRPEGIQARPAPADQGRRRPPRRTAVGGRPARPGPRSAGQSWGEAVGGLTSESSRYTAGRHSSAPRRSRAVVAGARTPGVWTARRTSRYEPRHERDALGRSHPL